MTAWRRYFLPTTLAAIAMGHNSVRLGIDYSFYYSSTLRNNQMLQRSSMVLLRDTNVSRVKIFTTQRELIQSLSDVWGLHELQLMIGIGNHELAALAEGKEHGKQLQELIHTVSMFAHRIEFIAVGNELDYPETNAQTVAPLILPVMQVLHSALLAHGLGHVRLTSPLSDMLVPDIIAVSGPSHVTTFPNSYDSSQGCMDPSCMDHHQVPLLKRILPVLDFVNRSNGVFSMSTYAFFKWRDLSVPYFCHRFGACDDVPLAFAVGAPDAPLFVDNVTGLKYNSLTAVMVDAIRYGLKRLGYPKIPFILTEAGWPTAGLGDPRANPGAACHFTNSLIRLLNDGTPAFPGVPLDAYLFQWVDESLKWKAWGFALDPGKVENHWGVLDSNLQPKYLVDWVHGHPSCPKPDDYVDLSLAPFLPRVWSVTMPSILISSLAVAVMVQFLRRREAWNPSSKKKPLLVEC